MKKYFSFFLIFIIFSLSLSAENMSVSFESYDMPGWYIGIRNEDAILIQLYTDIDKEYSTFTIVPGLDDEKHISIQAATDPNFYLREQNQTIKLHEHSIWMHYDMGATFKKEKGLADKKNRDLVSFRTWKFPEFFIRHKNGKLSVEVSDGSELFEKNTTFIIRPPNWDGKNRVSKERTGEKSFSSSRTASFAVFTFYIALVIIALIIVKINLRKKIKSTNNSLNQVKELSHEVIDYSFHQ
ncbi:MAG: AbfB domain-containing protein [Spirochaetales bacterium]|nr:AbfB domain-containing protein [Spirochaetales bacterium]